LASGAVITSQISLWMISSSKRALARVPIMKGAVFVNKRVWGKRPRLLTLREPLERHRSLANRGRIKSVVKTARKPEKREHATVDAKRSWGKNLDELMTVISSGFLKKTVKKVKK